MKKCGLAVLGGLFALPCISLCVMPQTHGQRGHVTAMHLRAEPSNYNGRCPVTIHFIGAITANGPLTMVYGIERSDGVRAKGGERTFRGAGTQRVTDTWRLGESYSGWEMIGSGNMRSNRATFRVHCGGKQIHMR